MRVLLWSKRVACVLWLVLVMGCSFEREQNHNPELANEKAGGLSLPPVLPETEAAVQVDVLPAPPLPEVFLPQPTCLELGPTVYGFPLCGGGVTTRSNDDLCPEDPKKSRPGKCGCGVEENDTDTDGDTVLDCIDNCLNKSNRDQIDKDQDKAGAACDCDDDNELVLGTTGIIRHVAPTGDDANNLCIDENEPCKTISHAISVAGDGDTVLLSKGTFLERNLIIDKDLQIFGQSSDESIVDAANPQQPHRVFGVNEEVEATFCRLTITNGQTKLNGGGILVDGVALVTDCVVTTNSGFDGGGIFVAQNGRATIVNSEISKNIGDRNAGAVASYGTMDVIRSTVSENKALTQNDPAAGNIGGIATFGLATITDSIIEKNMATNFGGGIGSAPGSTTNIVSSIIRENTSNHGAGIINFGELSLDTSTVTLNIARAFGGGVGTAGDTNIGKTRITNSTIVANQAQTGGGGGIGNNGETTVINSTVTGNSASTRGGGVYNVDNTFAILKINNTTVTDNTAPQGAGLANDDNLGDRGTVEVFHTIIANQAAGSDCYGTILSLNHNLESAQTCDFTASNDQQDTDPKLVGLTDNGGPTETHALMANSPAINGGASTCNVDTDQRGFPRSKGAQPFCDIGAFEVQP